MALHAEPVSPTEGHASAAQLRVPGPLYVPDVTVVTPTYNECANVLPLVQAVSAALAGLRWEMIFVDDDSPDGTYARVVAAAREGFPVRGIRRVGRRGLASAVVEGALSANSAVVGVIDADLQHDERLLPRMLELLQTTEADIVVASRYLGDAGLGDWGTGRRRMSSFATWASRLLVGTHVSDPMSGFFMTRRVVFDAAVYDLSQQGYKILLDLLTSSPQPLKVVELPYVFRDRRAGKSKVDALIVVEYGFLLIEKVTRGLIPPRFVMFVLIGSVGLILHLAALSGMLSLGYRFLPAQVVATLCAMTMNYVLNNLITYRTDRLQGMRFVSGYLTFCLVCSLGALANLTIANLTMTELHSWPLAGVAGALMSAVFNFGVTTQFVWRRRHQRNA